jgi:2-polyprenyl-6-methoxyphenol hydroxylase-like FAD-dependent oxidoreductase
MMLGLLLARRDIPVTVLEAHEDFDRDFRGDTLHPSILEILDQIGLAEPLHRLRHKRIYGPTLQAAGPVFLLSISAASKRGFPMSCSSRRQNF